MSTRLKHSYDCYSSKIRCIKRIRDGYYCDCFIIGYKSIKSRIVFRVVTTHYVSRTKNKYSKANRIHKSSFDIERKYFRSALKRLLCNKMIYSNEIIVLGRPGGRGALPYKRLIGVCLWMESHFHDWIDHNGVAFPIELLEWGSTFSDFWGKRVVHIYG